MCVSVLYACVDCWLLFLIFSLFFFQCLPDASGMQLSEGSKNLAGVSVNSVLKCPPMNWQALHWELKLHQKTRQHESRENAAGNKLNVCVSCFLCCVCVYMCVDYCLASKSREGIVTPDHALARHKKSHLLSMHCCNTYICTNVKSWMQVKYMTSGDSILLFFFSSASGAILSSLALLSCVLQSCLKPFVPTLKPTNTYSTFCVLRIPTDNN